MIEHAARQIGMDPAEIRRRNLIPEAKLPYSTPTHFTYDSGEFAGLATPGHHHVGGQVLLEEVDGVVEPGGEDR